MAKTKSNIGYLFLIIGILFLIIGIFSYESSSFFYTYCNYYRVSFFYFIGYSYPTIFDLIIAFFISITFILIGILIIIIGAMFIKTERLKKSSYLKTDTYENPLGIGALFSSSGIILIISQIFLIPIILTIGIHPIYSFSYIILILIGFLLVIIGLIFDKKKINIERRNLIISTLFLLCGVLFLINGFFELLLYLYFLEMFVKEGFVPSFFFIFRMALDAFLWFPIGTLTIIVGILFKKQPQ